MQGSGYDEAALPPKVGPYEVIEQLGAGAMGEVYLARSPHGELVAVKVVKAYIAAEPAYRARFRREVMAARAVSGTCTPAVVGADPDAERPWLASVYMPGPDLRTLVDEGTGPLDADALRDLGTALATALVSIHRAGLVHRDLKPGNVLMTADGPRVIDFGIVRPIGADFTRITEPGSAPGTPAFMSPEQAHGAPVVPASDVFSLGSVLAFAATGRLPFPQQGPALQRAVAEGRPALDGVPGSLRPVIEACLDKDPQRRPTPEELIAMLAAEIGEFSLTQRGAAPVRAATMRLIVCVSCVIWAALVVAAVHSLPGPLPVLVIMFGLFPPLFGLVFLRGLLRQVKVEVAVDRSGLRLRYGRARVHHPWEELEQVELVRPAVARGPAAAPWSLVASMRPGHRGTQPDPLRLFPGNRVGVNLRLTPREVTVLTALLARQRQAQEPPAADAAAGAAEAPL
ncbi:serine/threonine-protein kinase [Streptomyces xanthophaeus]